MSYLPYLPAGTWNGHEIKMANNVKSSKGELLIAKILNEKCFKFVSAATIGDKSFRYDFLLPDLDIVIQFERYRPYSTGPSGTLNESDKLEYAKSLGLKIHRLDETDIPNMEEAIDKIIKL